MGNPFSRKILSVFLLIVFVVTGWGLLLWNDFRQESNQLNAAGLIRLHILANSDSPGDQQIKLQVRDAVNAYLAPYLEEVDSVSAARQIVSEQRDNILRVAQAVVQENGLNYSVAMETGWFEFPVRSYGSLVLPAGKYEAVRILLGAAQGKNWWCVLFPPLCFIDGTGTVAAPAGIVGGEAKINSSLPPQVEFRWKVAEWWTSRQIAE
ncbi:MAG: stage II sporulation protein R [Negativicutes bacterium]|nr:stage II sporulation protein R [Negativicutes bacterium]